MNRIPRYFKSITATCLCGNGKGAQMVITKNENGYHGVDVDNGKRWRVLIGILRNENCFRIDRIER